MNCISFVCTTFEVQFVFLKITEKTYFLYCFTSKHFELSGRNIYYLHKRPIITLIIPNYAKFPPHFINYNKILFFNFTQSLFYYLHTEVILKAMVGFPDYIHKKINKL